jgi:predicted RNase H-like HicB family nuclease
MQEAEENARDAVLCYLTSMIKHGEPLPPAVAVDRELLGMT